MVLSASAIVAPLDFYTGIGSHGQVGLIIQRQNEKSPQLRSAVCASAWPPQGLAIYSISSAFAFNVELRMSKTCQASRPLRFLKQSSPSWLSAADLIHRQRLMKYDRDRT
jgi:hypothetical protein